MTDAVRKVLDLASELSKQERAKVAMEMLYSLDETDEELLDEEQVEMTDAFDAELDRRIAEIESGEATAIPADAAFADLKRRYK